MRKIESLAVLSTLVALVAITASLGNSACASARHNAVVVDSGLYDVLNAVHGTEQQALCGQLSCAGTTAVEAVPGWTLAKSQKFNKDLLPAVQAGQHFNQVLATWKPGTPWPTEVATLTDQLGTAVTDITNDFPDSPTKSAILSKIGTAQTTLLKALSLVLAVKGT